MWVVVKIRVPFWGTLIDRCRMILGIPKGTLILTTTQVFLETPVSEPELRFAFDVDPKAVLEAMSSS